MESTGTGVYSPRSRCTLWSGTAPPQFFVSHVQKSRCSGRFVCSKLDYTRCCNLPHQISGGNQLTVGIPLELQLPVRQEANRDKGNWGKWFTGQRKKEPGTHYWRLLSFPRILEISKNLLCCTNLYKECRLMWKMPATDHTVWMMMRE